MTGRAVVVGGGIAGLATAALLGREGYQVTLLEARDQFGGRTGRWERDGFVFDTGPSWYLMPEAFDHFFALLGTSTAEQLDLMDLDPGYRVFYEKYDPLDVPADADAVVDLFESIEPGAGRRLRRYLASASEAYTLALKHFLYITYASWLPLVNRHIVRRMVRLMRMLVESLEHRIHATFADTRLRQILGYPAVFLGSSPALTPSMFHLMSHLDLSDGVRYPRGGLYTLITAIEDLARAEGADLRTGADVTRILTRPVRGLPGGRRAEVTGVTYTDADGSEHRLDADVVVSTADLFQTETVLLPPELRSRSGRWWRRRTPGPSAVMVYLGVRGELPQLAHHSLFFTDDWQAGFGRIFGPPQGPEVPFCDPASIYVSRAGVTDPTVAPDGMENVVILIPVSAEPDLGAGGPDGTGSPWVEAVADAAIAQLGAWADIPDLADRIVLRQTLGPQDYAVDLRAFQGTALGMAHTLGQSAMFRANNISRRVGGLYNAGASVLPGIGLPICLISAELIVKRLRGDTSGGPLPEPLTPVTSPEPV